MGARFAREGTPHNAACPAARTGPGSCMASGRRAHRRDRTHRRIRNWDVYAVKSRCVGQRIFGRSPADFGIVLTTGAAPPRPLRLPHGYQFLDLREIARPEQNCLVIDKIKLVGWTKGLRKRLDKPAQLRPGRPSHAALVDEVFRERRAQALPFVNQRAEAGKIRAEIALRHPERDPSRWEDDRAPLAKASRELIDGCQKRLASFRLGP